MNIEQKASRLAEKTSLQAIQVELQQGYNLSPVEALVLARRVQQLVDEQTGFARQPGQVIYHAISLDEPPGKPLRLCSKVPVHLTVLADDDAQVWAKEGAPSLRRIRVHRLTYEALMQGGALSQEDLACILGLSQRTIKREFAHFREQGQPLPSRGEVRDIGRGVSHKIPVIRRYVQDLSFSRISRALGQHGVTSMARYLRHFAMVMILQDRGLTASQMQSVIGISENLIAQYRALYHELNESEYQRVLDRLKQTAFHLSTADQNNTGQADGAQTADKKGGGR
jgi:hypothetical protein